MRNLSSNQDRISEILSDVRLVWKNTYAYNQKGSSICNNALSLEREFEERLTNVEAGTSIE
jgi:hypothetical protein